MNILLINQDWFANDLRELGHRVVTFGRTEILDIKQEKFLITWKDLKATLPKNFEPEIVIIHDNSMPVLITELETIDIPTLFYSVDTHHHLELHRYLGLVFSNTYVAQRDYISGFLDFNYKPHWLPLWASIYMEPSPEKNFGAVFLGTLNPVLNPDRVKFFNELQNHVPIDVRTAGFADIFPKSEIVVNQTVKGDLNFRVFEAMMSGALLLTEDAGNGLNDLFENKKHLVLYEKGNVEDAASKIKYYLEHKDEAAKIALAGRELVCTKHQSLHRTEFLLSTLDQTTRPNDPRKSFAPIRNFSVLASQLALAGDKLWSTRAFLEVLRITHLGLQESAELDSSIAIDIMRALLCIEPITSKAVIQDTLDNLRNAYPQQAVFHLVKIDQLANTGKQDLAQALASSLSHLPAEEVIQHAGEIVRELRI